MSRPVTPPSVAGIADRPRWQTLANCRGIDPTLFYPTVGETAKAPKAVCAGCTVRTECLDYAVTRNELDGIWGGTSRKERQAIRRQLREAS